MSKEGETKSSSILLAIVFALTAFAINKLAFKPPVLPDAPEGFSYIDGRLFSNEMQFSKSKQLFLGGGTREFNGATVYATGVYLDESTVNSLKKKYKSDDVAVLSKDSAFFRNISESKEKTLILKVHRTVHTLKVSSMISTDLKKKADEKDIKEFSNKINGLVSKDRVFKDFEFYINCKGDSVKITKSFEELAETESFTGKGFCNALFQSYLGQNSIAKPVIGGVAKAFIELN